MPQRPKLLAISLEYVLVRMDIPRDVDPSQDQVKMAFMAYDETKPPLYSNAPAGSDWKTASWSNDGDSWAIQCEVGPAGATTLAPGEYVVYVKVVDNPEVPAKRSGRLTVE